MSGSEVVRCGWVGKYTGAGREDYVKVLHRTMNIFFPGYLSRYHDNEWGVPVVADDRLMFEMISLEGAQAGLSWATILAKRSGYKKAFKDFDIEALVGATEEASSMDVLVDAVLDSGCDVVRSRRKIESVYRNAEAARAVREEFGGLCQYIWHFTGGQQVVNSWTNVSDIPSHTDLSKRIAEDMKRRGFRMVGPTTVYSLLQAVGVVNDHMVACHRYKACVRKMQDCKITTSVVGAHRKVTLRRKRKRSV
ncbi:DNA-3-methyladenine glycosylase, putative [Perkinsus marinus ATCC 50983]|uniref:DNA-3-methyladenine glycosylase, putative n=1 Tax=Perkinsus marinus (strain ATCC 50983 / TXsc) TaxID=423536 RepID=C5LIZ3_PERM5|nr:DNA-3-methyladenine glycosylase, putative [Perkinsus marinus ATCC 50983]EER03328.1 DNA-3-methyladenine glycosylase, putative [Perkinsus marinus ATCC 50983]|eukprot:XP_002771512.1 DNA-3-methyladenine glycosylase, putative [Perkinsus marinus ATCC 50983]